MGPTCEALAARLGVGERQLRRLFRQHLGASPIAVAQTRRVLLAKHLIHETRPADVGGRARGGLRQHPPVQRDLPAAVRPAAEHAAARERRRRRPGPRGRSSILLPLSAALRLAGHARASSRARAIPGVETVSERRLRAHDRDRRRARHASRCGPRRRNALRAAIQFPQLSALPTIVARLRRVFDLIADPEVIGAQLSEDPALAPLVAARPGLRVPGAWDGFELAVRALLGQQITVTAARGLAGRLVATYGEPLAGGGEGLTPRLPRRRAAGRRRPVDPRPARARAAALGSLARAVVADPQIFGPRRDPRGSDRAAARAPRHRRVDRAVHRDAGDARARRVPRRRHRPDARDGRSEGPPADAGRAARARRALAALARVRRATPVGVRGDEL